MLKVNQFNPEEPEVLLLRTGVYTMCVTMEDMWGAKTVYDIPGTITVLDSGAHAS